MDSPAEKRRRKKEVRSGKEEEQEKEKREKHSAGHPDRSRGSGGPVRNRSVLKVTEQSKQ